MSLILLTIIVVVIFTLWLKHSRAKEIAEEVTKNFPSPPRVPILGFSNLTKYGPRNPYNMFRTVMDFSKDYGPTVVFHRLFNEYDIVITKPADVETVLNEKNIKKADSYDFLEEWLGQGLLTSIGAKWFRRRKLITPTFHFQILEKFFEVFIEQDKIFIKNLEKYVDSNQECNIYKLFGALALDNICETAMGVSIHAQDDPNSEYCKAIAEIGELMFTWFFSPLSQFPSVYNWIFFTAARKKKRCVDILHRFTNGVIRDRQNQLHYQSDVKEIPQEGHDVEGQKQRLSFLDMLLQSKIDGKPLSHSDIQEEVDTFMFEGHDTTTIGLTFAIYNIAMHPEVQEKIFDELRHVYGNDPSVPPSFTSIQELKYLEKVIRESQRLHPSVPIYGRKTLNPIQIDGVTVPAGVNIQIPLYIIHRNETVFPDPTKFDPERFDASKDRNYGIYTYLPFSAGSRNCIGQKFAMIEMKTIISTFLRNYKVVATEKTKNMTFQSDMVLRPRDGLFIKLERRKY